MDAEDSQSLEDVFPPFRWQGKLIIDKGDVPKSSINKPWFLMENPDYMTKKVSLKEVGCPMRIIDMGASTTRGEVP